MHDKIIIFVNARINACDNIIENTIKSISKNF
jgi:hypothetical protein